MVWIVLCVFHNILTRYVDRCVDVLVHDEQPTRRHPKGSKRDSHDHNSELRPHRPKNSAQMQKSLGKTLSHFIYTLSSASDIENKRILYEANFGEFCREPLFLKLNNSQFFVGS